MSWSRWLSEFDKEMRARGFTARTRETYGGSVAAFVAYLAAHRLGDPRELTSAVLEAYQVYLFEYRNAKGRRLTVNTQAGRLMAVRSFCKYLTRRKALLVDPSRELVLPKVTRRLPRAILTPAEVTRFLRSIPVGSPLGLRDRAIFETLYSTGLRVGELIRLVPSDVDLVEGYVYVRVGKGGYSRVVPLGRIAAAWIRRYLDSTKDARSGNAPLFVSFRGTPLIGHQISARARRWAKRAKIEKRVTCHTFRHSCATHMLKGRASLRHIQELLGHRDASTTQVYTRVTVYDLKKVHQRCHPRNRKR